MKKIFVLASIFIFLGAMCFCLHGFSKIKNIVYDSETEKYSCEFKNQIRKYILCTPENFDNKSIQEKSETNLILMLHGYGGDARAFKSETQFEQNALSENYVVIYVNGTPNPNIPGSSSGWHYNDDSLSKNDMKFIVELAKHYIKQLGLGKKIFVVGFSNGAFMANKLAIVYPKFFTAVASVGGMMPESVWNNRRQQKNKIGFIQINGTKDEVVPMELNNSTKYNPNPAMEKVIEYFVDINNISAECEEKVLSERTIAKNYGSKVSWVLIQDGKHNWPTERWSLVNVNQIIIDFFNQQ